MELQILPIDPEFDASVLEDLSVIAEDARSFEELISLWLSPERSLAFARNDASDEHCVGISFVDKSGGTFVGKLSTAEVLRLYSGAILFPAASHQVDDEWILERNERLGIEYDEETDTFLSPPESMGELIVTYSLAPLGYAEITLEEKENNQQLVHLDLVYFETRNTPAWGEEFYVDVNELEGFLNRLK